MKKTFDIIVIGGGHAGVEACYGACQYKSLSVGLVTLKDVGIGSAPCNPAIGGVGKGQVVREIDALGGIMGKLADLAGIQYRTLNESKGYAVQSTRIQIDKDKYSQYAEEELKKLENLEIVYGMVSEINKKEKGFEIFFGESKLFTKKLILTVGTFLAGKLHIGSEQTNGGRVECKPSPSMNELFSSIKTGSKKFKTGTPPRLNKHSIDYSVLEEQPSDEKVDNFHLFHVEHSRNLEQVSCYLAYTNNTTLTHIRENKNKSPMYNGQIEAVGARYCPSIEDKAYRYPDKDIHHVFIEPEGLDLETMYPSGISSSLPRDVQDEFISSIKGLESAKIEQYGYAVEYDVVDTTYLSHSLEHKEVPGLYFAGQVNGTSGYEEAAGQGLISGVNAALKLLGRDELVLSRMDSYIGVMIEDLITNTRDEPYRLFTARAENRLYIREDNALLRMCPYRSSLGLATDLDNYLAVFKDKYTFYCELLDKTFVENTDKEIASLKLNVPRRTNLSDVIKQSADPVETAIKLFKAYGLDVPSRLARAIAITKKYEGYIKKSKSQSEKQTKLGEMKVSWEKLCSSRNISFECKQRIEKIKPITFSQLKLIDGIRPATLATVASGSL